PVPKGPLGELHNVAFVHQGHRFELLGNGILQGAPRQPLRTHNRHGLNSNAGVEPHFLFDFVFLQEGIYKFDKPPCLGSPFAPLDTGVHVFSVFTEDDDVHLFGPPNGRWHTRYESYGAPTSVQVQQLAERYVQAAYAATHWSRERALDRNAKFLDGVERSLRQPFAKLSKGLLSRKYFVPNNPPLAAEDFLHCGVKNALRGLPNIATGSITFNVGNHRSLRNRKCAVRISYG